MTFIELQHMRQYLRQKLVQLDGLQANCTSCEHFPDGRQCNKWQAEPPPEFIRQPGQCPDWQHDGVPF